MGGGGRGGRKVRDEVCLDLLHLWSSPSQTSRTQVVFCFFLVWPLYQLCCVTFLISLAFCPDVAFGRRTFGCDPSYQSVFVLGNFRQISGVLSWCDLFDSTYITQVVFGTDGKLVVFCDHAHITRLSTWSDLCHMRRVLVLVWPSSDQLCFVCVTFWTGPQTSDIFVV